MNQRQRDFETSYYGHIAATKMWEEARADSRRRSAEGYVAERRGLLARALEPIFSANPEILSLTVDEAVDSLIAADEAKRRNS